MYNPFIRLDQRLLNALRETGNLYFVRQYYRRGARLDDSNYKVAFLITHYHHPEAALEHLTAIEATDPYAFLYKVIDPAHLSRLEAAAGDNPAFPVYSPLHANTNWIAPKEIISNLHYYIDKHLRKWPVRSLDEVLVNLHCIHGELTLLLRYKTLTHRVPLVNIETMLAPKLPR